MSATPDGPDDPHEAPRRPHAARPRADDEEPAVASSPAPTFDPEAELPGAVFMVPNAQWGFDSLTSEDHPGACVHYQPAQRQGVLVKGTDAGHVRSPWRYFFLEATLGNGLGKRTAFELRPRFFRLHRLKLYHPERHLGRLDDGALRALRAELARLYPEE